MSDIRMSDTELLKYAVENGMIDTALLQEKIEMQKREELLKLHPYSIWEGNDGYWHSYLPKDNGRKPIKKNTREKIEDAVIEYWKDKDKNDNTFSRRFEVWIDRQRKCGRNGNTIDKYMSDYKRFFKGDKIENIPIKDISEEEISEFIGRLLKEKEIPWRALKAMFGYMVGVFDKAKTDRLITENPCDHVDLPIFRKDCTEPKPKTAKERTVSDAEKKKLLKKLNREKEGPVNIARCAVELSIYTGMRVGELAGLKWEDIHYDDNVIIICRSEKFDREKKEHYISATKNDKVRFFPLTDSIRNVLEKTKKLEMANGYLSDFVFSDENGRVHKERISECARNMTMSREFEHSKSIHALRRTLNSKMRCSGVSAPVAAALLGHSERVNEENYTYDISDLSEKAKIIEMAERIS